MPLQAEIAPVAAASDLVHVLPELEGHFRNRTGHALRVSFGSSGNLTRQILQGAPFEVFLSANEDYVFKLADEGLTEDRGLIYALGRLVLFIPARSAVSLAADLSSLQDALANGSLRRLAIANPEHAPYGMAAREALRSAGLWDSIQKVLVMGENAAQAAQFSVSGNVDAGIIPYATTAAPSLAARGRFILVADALYRPLRQRMVLIKGAGSAARSFFDFMHSTEAKAIMTRYGFAEL